jgi:RNA polymerase sigma-70 factor (ECF subfamily)
MPTHLDNEQSIVAAAQAGDSDAFITLLNQYSRHIYRLGLSITGNHQDAEDVLQESSLKAYRAIAEFQGNSRFYTWLVRIAVNVALGKLRKRALWKESSLDEPREGDDGSYVPLEIESWGDDPEKACLHNELHRRLLRQQHVQYAWQPPRETSRRPGSGTERKAGKNNHSSDAKRFMKRI